jgi:hypothetical protein
MVLAATAEAKPVTINPVSIKACLLLLQALYIDVEDLLGAKQARQFEQDISTVFTSGDFPRPIVPSAVENPADR